MNVQTAVFWKFRFYFSNTFRFWKSAAWKKYWILLPQKKAAVLFWSVGFLMKLKSITLKKNVHLTRVNTRNSDVWTSKSSPAMFRVITHTKQFFRSCLEISQMSVQNLNLLMRWNKIQKMLLKSYRQEYSFQKSRCFSPCFQNHLFFSTSKLIKTKSILDFLDAEKRFEK